MLTAQIVPLSSPPLAPDLSVFAPVAELVDAIDSKSIVRKDVPVRVRPGAPNFFFKICA